VKTETDSTIGLAASMILSTVKPLAIKLKIPSETTVAIIAVAILVPNFIFFLLSGL